MSVISYRQARDLGRVEARRISPLHIITVLRDQALTVIELTTPNETPRWLPLCKRLSRHDARRALFRASSIPPAAKAVFMQLLDNQPEEVRA